MRIKNGSLCIRKKKSDSLLSKLAIDKNASIDTSYELFCTKENANGLFYKAEWDFFTAELKKYNLNGNDELILVDSRLGLINQADLALIQYHIAKKSELPKYLKDI